MAEETKETTPSKKAPRKGAKKKPTAKKKTAKPRAAKKSGSEGAHGSKTQFIADHAHLKPKQVSVEAKKKGMDISPGYVSSVRSKAKAHVTGGAKGQSGRAKPPRADAEAAFRRAVRGITLDRAQEILEEIAAAYDG